MAHVFEPAKSGRSKCRGCSRPIERGELRLGERVENPFAEGHTLLWFHPLCAAYKRPSVVLEALAETRDVPGREALERIALASSAHRRLPRVDGGERAPTGKAKCRSCHEPIAKGTWRIRLVFHEEGRFSPAGSVHLSCRGAYFEGHAVDEAVLHFSRGLSDEERGELRAALEAPG